MPIPIANNGSTFYNINVCRSFKQTISTNLIQLSTQPCSEAIIVNRTGADLLVYDNEYLSDFNAFLLSDGESFTFRGITNTSTISAKTTSGAGSIYYRTQYFSNLNQR
jgi:hypothetical protein